MYLHHTPHYPSDNFSNKAAHTMILVSFHGIPRFVIISSDPNQTLPVIYLLSKSYLFQKSTMSIV
jgi:protoheme ferro-lyase